MANRLFQRNWVGGEISPDMFGRVEDGKTSYAAQTLRNFIVTPQGVARKRCGTKLVREVRNSAQKVRLIPFAFSITETLVVEVGAGYFRYHTQGATVLPNAPAYVPSASVTFDGGLGVVNWTAHGLSQNEPVQFTTSGTLPPGIVAGIIGAPTPTQSYYANIVGPNQITLMATPNGLPVPITGSGTGAHVGRRFYDFGEVVVWNGSPGPTGNYYCLFRTIATSPPTFTNWWRMLGGVLETPNPYAEADLFDLHYTQSGDILTLVHPNYPPSELRRWSPNRWSFGSTLFGSLLQAPTGLSVAVNRGAGNDIFAVSELAPARFVTQSPHNFVPEDAVYMEGFAGTGITFPTGVYRIAQVPEPFSFRLKSVAGGILQDATGTYAAPPAARAKAFWTSLSADTINSYVVTSVSADGTESTPSLPISANNNLLVPGSSNSLSWPAVSGAVRYFVYREISGLYAFVGQTSTTTFLDDNIDPDASKTPPIFDPSLSLEDYPGAVGYFEQRRVFAGTKAKPQDVWMTKSGSEFDLTYSLPVQDTDRIYVRIAGRTASRILHVVPLQQLLLLTNSTEYRLSPVNTDALTPSSVSVRPQSYVGASNVQPLVVNGSLVYGAARGGHIREMGFQDRANGYVTGDLSLRAAHLFDDFQVTDMAQQKAPVPILWFVSSSGKLLGLTYIPEEGLGAWHQHDTDGSFESVCSVAEGTEDIIYLVVQRNINGTLRRFVEFVTVEANDRPGGVYLDCALTYSGAAATTISGLGHLVGETVYALADGVVRGPFTVSGGGSIVLPVAATPVHVGLRYFADLVTPPLAIGIDGMGQGRTKNVNATHVRIVDSGTFLVGPTESQLVRANATAALTSGEIDLKVIPGWNRDGTVWIRSADPLPLKVTGLTIEVSIGS